MVTIPTIRLNIQQFTFCLQSAFICFVCISEHTLTFVLCSIKRVVFISEMESIYCVVQLGSLKKTLHFVIKGLKNLLCFIRIHKRPCKTVHLFTSNFANYPSDCAPEHSCQVVGADLCLVCPYAGDIACLSLTSSVV